MPDRSLNILVIDDNKIDRFMVAQELTRFINELETPPGKTPDSSLATPKTR